jgi:hypothetical protein
VLLEAMVKLTGKPIPSFLLSQAYVNVNSNNQGLVSMDKKGIAVLRSSRQKYSFPFQGLDDVIPDPLLHDLLSKFLDVDPSSRLRIKYAELHPFFSRTYSAKDRARAAVAVAEASSQTSQDSPKGASGRQISGGDSLAGWGGGRAKSDFPGAGSRDPARVAETSASSGLGLGAGGPNGATAAGKPVDGDLYRVRERASPDLLDADTGPLSVDMYRSASGLLGPGLGLDGLLSRGVPGDRPGASRTPDPHFNLADGLASLQPRPARPQNQIDSKPATSRSPSGREPGGPAVSSPGQSTGPDPPPQALISTPPAQFAPPPPSAEAAAREQDGGRRAAVRDSEVAISCLE